MSYSVECIERYNAEGTVEQDGRVTRKYSRSYLYRDNSPDWLTHVQIFTNVGIVPGAPFFDDPFATASNGKITHGIAGKTKPPHFACQVDFTWSTHAPLPDDTSTDPKTRRVLWKLRPTIQSQYLMYDRNGDPILNSAGQPFTGGVPCDVRMGTAIASKNYAAAGFNRDAVLAYSGNVNKLTYLGGAPGTVQVDCEAEEIYKR